MKMLQINGILHGDVTLENVAKACTEFAGGGHNEEQSINTLRMYRDLIEGRSIKAYGRTIRLIEVDDE